MSENKALARAIDRIAYYLAARDHSKKELQTKLSRHFEPDVVNDAIESAQHQGWLIEPQVLSQRIQDQLYRRGKGHLYILNQLRKKGLPEVFFDEDREFEVASSVIETKYPGWRQSDQKGLSKAFRFLLSRGFISSVVFNLKKDR